MHGFKSVGIFFNIFTEMLEFSIVALKLLHTTGQLIIDFDNLSTEPSLILLNRLFNRKQRILEFSDLFELVI